MSDSACEIPDVDVADRELIGRAQRGTPGAFDELVRRHQAIAYRTARLMVGAADAEDVAQDAFVNAYRALSRFDADLAFRPWLLAIVANRARDHGRAAARRRAALVRFGARRWCEPLPDELAESAAGGRRLLHAMGGLPEKERLVLHCRYLLDLSEAETAAVLGIPAGTVKSRSSRALDRLRSRLAEEVEDDA